MDWRLGFNEFALVTFQVNIENSLYTLVNSNLELAAGR